jgi:cell division protein FtsN
MSQSDQKKPPKPNKPSQDQASKGNPLLTGILIGLVLGVGLCSSVAIWIARSPSPFTNRALQTMGIMKGNSLQTTASVPESSASNPASPPAGSGEEPSPSSARSLNPSTSSSASLPDAASNNAVSGSSQSPSPTPNAASEPAKPSYGGTLYVQVGAFSTLEEAQKQVEIVAQLTGQKAKIWLSNPSDSGKVLYKVRLGSFAQTSDTNELTQILKSNGVSFAFVRPATGETAQ